MLATSARPVRNADSVPTGTYFADWVAPQAADAFEADYGEVKVPTTLDADLQKIAVRAVAGAPIGDASVYVVDTLGELGTFFALAPATFMAGSLLPALAGHNPIEPAKAGSAIVSGPHVRSFNDLYAALRAAGAMRLAHDANAIASAIGDLWTNDGARAAQIEAAARIVDRGQSTLSATVERLLALLDRRAIHAPA